MERNNYTGPRQSGRYLIAGIKHISGGKYQMTLRCCKDAVKGYLLGHAYQSKKQEKEVYDIYEEDKRIMAGISVIY